MTNAFPSLYLDFYIQCPDCIITGTDKPGFLRDIPHHLLLPRTYAVCVWQCERNIQATLVHITDSSFPTFLAPCMYSCLCICTCIRSRFESDCVSLFCVSSFISLLCLSSNQPVFISHSLNILSLLRRSLFSIFFAVTRTLSVHSFTHSPELLSFSLSSICVPSGASFPTE